MPATQDKERWVQTGEGTWRRTVNGVEETTAVNPNATETAKQAAEELGVDIAEIEGSGKEGRITKADVEKAVNG